MRKEKSCGCIIIDEDKVLLIYEKDRNFWGFPKGHVEFNETEFETALREVKEEVGLDVIIDEETRYEINYIVRNEIDKTAVYFIATPKSKKIILQPEEIEDSRWCTYEEAMNLIDFVNLSKVLEQVKKDGFL